MPYSNTPSIKMGKHKEESYPPRIHTYIYKLKSEVSSMAVGLAWRFSSSVELYDAYIDVESLSAK